MLWSCESLEQGLSSDYKRSCDIIQILLSLLLIALRSSTNISNYFCYLSDKNLQKITLCCVYCVPLEFGIKSNLLKVFYFLNQISVLKLAAQLKCDCCALIAFCTDNE